MLVFPPLPPKDYHIENIPRNLLSSYVFTPDADLRVTIPEIGLHAVPIAATLKDPPPEAPYKPVHPAVVNGWVHKERYNWLIRPGKEDYFLHDVYKKHNVLVQDSYDVRYLHKPPIFPRSFKYELDCMESFRLEKLQEKILRDDVEGKRRQQKRTMFVEPGDVQKPHESTTYKRWQPQPHIFAPSQTDPCIRRSEFGLVGRPFKNEACSWYYENYPPPAIKWAPQRFA